MYNSTLWRFWFYVFFFFFQAEDGIRDLYVTGVQTCALPIFAFGVLVLVWWLLGATVTVANLACLALAAVFPGSVYDHAVVPVSLCTLASLACLGLLVRSRWVAAGFVGAAA